MLPTESSLYCDKCDVYNIQCGNAIIIDGEAYCEGCIKRRGLLNEFNKLKEHLLKAK